MESGHWPPPNLIVGRALTNAADLNEMPSHGIVAESDHIALVEATPAGYREKGHFEIPDSGYPSWAHPVVSGGRLYLRNQSSLAAFDIKAK